MSKKSALLGIAISTFLGTSLTVTAAYVTGYISLIGYNSQLIPVFTGVIIGVVLFSLLGTVLEGRLKNILIYLSAASLVLYAIVYSLIEVADFVTPNSEMTALAVGISAGFMPVAAFVKGAIFTGMSRKTSVILAAVSSILAIVSVLVIAVVYELSGQASMIEELDLTAMLSLVFLILLFATGGGRK